MPDGSLNLKDHFNLDRNIPGKNVRPEGASSPDPGVSEHFTEKLAVTVDGLRLIHKIIRAVHESERFDHALDPIERTKFRLDRSEESQPNLTRRRLPFLEGEIFAEAPRHVGAVILKWTVP